MEHGEVDQGVGRQEEVGDDGGNDVQFSCGKKKQNIVLLKDKQN